MGKTPIFGVCALCLQHRQLCKSHYLGKAIHRLMHRESLGGQIVFTPKLITQSPRQLAAHLPDRECEERIAKVWGAPVLALINRGNTFRLPDRMTSATPIETDAQLAAYSGRVLLIDIEALVYYALSLAVTNIVRAAT
jgi:hypothetical protein